MGDLVQREYPKIRVESGWGQEHKNLEYSISEPVQDMTKVTMTDYNNRKSAITATARASCVSVIVFHYY